MFKKALFIALFLSSIPAALFAGTGDSESVNKDKVGYFGDGPSRTLYKLRVTSSGHVLSDTERENHLGAPSKEWGNVYTSTLTVSSGILVVHEYFSDIPTASTPNALVLTTTTLVTAGTTYITGDLTQPDYPRNVVVYSSFSFVGGSTITVVATATVYGQDVFNRFVSEQIAFSTNTGVGNIAFASVSSVTVVCSSVSTVIPSPNIAVNIGYGVKIGLSNKVTQTADVYKVLESNVNVAVSAVTLNTTYNTITFTTPPNATRDYNVWIKPTVTVPR